MSLTQVGTLRQYLRQLDLGLADTADMLWQISKPIHDRANRPDSNENGYAHALQVEANIWKLIRESGRKGEFSALDLFLLSCGACCHDFDKGLKSALEDNPPHGVGSQQYAKGAELEVLLSQPVQVAIGEIISLHDLKTKEFEDRIRALKKQSIQNETVDLQRLAVLLKAADILHCDASRVPRLGVDVSNLSDENSQRAKYLARNCTSGWEVEGARIVLLALPRDGEQTAAVRAVHKYICTEEWLAVDQRLDDLHFPHQLYLVVRREGEPETVYPPSTASAAPLLSLHQIGDPVADFVGREGEIDTLLAAFDGASQRGAIISGLRGMGGVGKTELAKVIAKRLRNRFPDGQLAFNLRGARDDDSSKPATLAEALQHVIRSFYPEAKLPDDLDALRGLFHSVLDRKRVLLLMDNALNAHQLSGLVPLPDGCGLMVTSRYRFVLTGMTEIDLHTLPPKDAQMLLLEICPRIGEHAYALAERCGYLPLALRLAAAALKTRPMLRVSDYLEDLRNEKTRLATLDEYRNSTDEARGIEASLTISYRLLEAGQQRHWRALAVFPADFDTAAAGSVWKAKERVARNALGDLYAASMVEWDKATKRFRLHELGRVYALARLSEKERTAYSQRHAAHYVGVLRKADGLYLKGGDAILQGLALFDRDWANIRAGQAWAAAHWEADTPPAILCKDYPSAGVYCLNLRLHFHELIVWLEAAVAAARKLKDRKAEGRQLGNLGLAYADFGEARKAIECHQQDLAIAREVGDRRGEGSALGNLGNAYFALDETSKAIGFYEQRLVIAREIGHRRGEGNVLGNLGNAYLVLGKPRKAVEFYQQHLAIAREIGDRRGEESALRSLGVAYANLGEPRTAIEFYEQALAIAREIGDRRGQGGALGNLGNAFLNLGNPGKAIEHYEQALVITHEIGDRRSEEHSLSNLGDTYADLGETHKAIEYYKQALVIDRAIGDQSGEGNAHFKLADELVKTGRRDEAIAHATQAVEIFEQIESPYAAEARALLERLNRGE